MGAPSVLRSAPFWYIRDCKMVLDSVACNNVSFPENHAFYCFLVHEESLTINMQSSPYWSNSKQLDPVRMFLHHWKLMLYKWLLKFSKVPMNGTSMWAQEMDWCWTGVKPSTGVMMTYHQISNISRTFLGSKLVDYSDVVGASTVNATARLDDKHFIFWIWCGLY